MFSVYEKIKELAKSRGKSLGQVEEELGYGRNTLYKIKHSSPSADRLQEIADYFGVTLDYLVGRSDNPSASPDSTTIDLSNLRERVVLFDGKPLSDDDVKKIAQIIELSLGVDSIDR